MTTEIHMIKQDTKTYLRLTSPAGLALLPLALLLTACGGGGNGGYGDTNTPAPTTPPLLQVGMQRTYSGTATRTVVFANPSATSVNNTLSYTFNESQSVLQAPAGAPGSFNIHSVFNYTITQDPGTGTVPISQTVDDYRNLVTVGTSQATVDMGQTTTVLNSDETANALGSGPFTETTSTTTRFTTPRTSFYYPLTAGASLSVPQSSTQSITFSDLNALGISPPNGSNVSYTRTRTRMDDGSFSYQQLGATGTQETLVQNSDGSGSTTITNATTSTVTTLGTPVLGGTGLSLPITRTITSSTPSTKTYSAADWYPNAGQASSPLILSKQTVVGPVATLPAECSGALSQPNMFEIDSTTTNLNTINATYTVSSSRSFNANGVAVCTLTQQTATNYALLTGAVVSTTTTQTTTLLKSM